MTKLMKFFAAAMLVVSIICSAPGHAEARCDYYRGCGQWGAWGWGPWGPGVGWGRATHISTARDAGGSVFASGIMATGSFAAIGAAGDR